MTIKNNRIGLISLALGWLWDFLFWEHTPGISFAVYVALCVLSGFFLLYSFKLKVSPKTMWLLVFIAIFMGFSCIRQEPLSLLLSIGCTLLLLQILAISIVGENWTMFGFEDYFLGFLRLWRSIIIHPIITLAKLPEQINQKREKSFSHFFWQTARGLLLALPIVIIYTALFNSADLVFAQKFGAFLNLFSLENVPEYLLRLMAIFLIAFALMGVFSYAFKNKPTEKPQSEKTSLIPPFLGFTESMIVMGSVATLFTAFVIVQLQYFFGGQANIHIDGYTYSEYVRRGFGELIAVAIITLVLLLALSNFTRREHALQRKIFSGLSLLWVGLVGIILVSAFQRLLLYESIYGFTRLRTYTHVFMIWLGILLGMTALLEIISRLNFFTNATLLFTLGFALTINLIDVDGLIVQRNIARVSNSEEIDVAYLASLSTDAVPVMVSLFQSDALPNHTHDAIGASLACMIQMKPDVNIPPKSWQSFQFSHWQAEKALKAVDKELDEYKAVFQDYMWQVTSPENQNYDCQSGWMID
jgi:hypothetical protein